MHDVVIMHDIVIVNNVLCFVFCMKLKFIEVYQEKFSKLTNKSEVINILFQLVISIFASLCRVS
jgi:hypothetical protein